MKYLHKLRQMIYNITIEQWINTCYFLGKNFLRSSQRNGTHSVDRDKSACFRSFIIFQWYSMSWGVHHSISVPLDRGGFCDITIRGVWQLTRRRRIANMAGRAAVGAAVRAVNKPRKFAARRAAITLVSLTNSRIFLLRLNSRHTGQQ